ncbi:MAG: CUAEP/CCAEP-tail radical SAM protein, partial [Actinomycetota bacterium]|nr:CUAEP/CCAEP-tail radical SAM protein [Actinomycetota bacterium]
VLLISTYELGRQPFGLASPAAWLRERGAQVSCNDVAVEPFDDSAALSADLVCFHVPMHTATRIAAPLIERVRALNPGALICCYGLYAPVNEGYLRSLGADVIIGGEFEQGIVDLVDDQAGKLPPLTSLARQRFVTPDRTSLPPLELYARVSTKGQEVVTGYTEGSRGCKHLCRHCPIVPVYNGTFRVVQLEVVLSDIEQQIARGARHITFGDPDFFNAPRHAEAIVTEVHNLWPELTYDVTIKVEHLLKHSKRLETLASTGCLFVTSAVESVDDRVLELLDKGHTRADFIAAVALLEKLGLVLNPTFVAFTPWISMEGYRDLLEVVRDLGLIDNVSPVQLAIRLLIVRGSRLLELPGIRELVGPFDDQRLVYPWKHPDAEVDALYEHVQAVAGETTGDRRTQFQRVCALAGARYEDEPRPAITVPYLTEPWYC